MELRSECDEENIVLESPLLRGFRRGRRVQVSGETGSLVLVSAWLAGSAGRAGARQPPRGPPARGLSLRMSCRRPPTTSWPFFTRARPRSRRICAWRDLKPRTAAQIGFVGARRRVARASLRRRGHRLRGAQRGRLHDPRGGGRPPLDFDGLSFRGRPRRPQQGRATLENMDACPMSPTSTSATSSSRTTSSATSCIRTCPSTRAAGAALLHLLSLAADDRGPPLPPAAENVIEVRRAKGSSLRQGVLRRRHVHRRPAARRSPGSWKLGVTWSCNARRRSGPLKV